MDRAQPVLKEMFSEYDIGLMDKMFDPYDHMNEDHREGKSFVDI